MTKIPNILHFVHGLEPISDSNPFNLSHYIAIKSAITVNKPKQVYFWHKYLPENNYLFELLRPSLNLMEIEVPKEIFGNPIKHFAHKADVIRMRSLKKFGGIYLDMDTISLRPFTDLLDHEMVMGLEYMSNYGSFQNGFDSFKSIKPKKAIQEIYSGLCNAVMLAAPENAFINAWYDTYQNFNCEKWGETSIVGPLKLHKTHPELAIKILQPEKFFYPSYDRTSLKLLFTESSHSWDLAKFHKNLENDLPYIHHLWSSFAKSHLSKLTIQKVLKKRSYYHDLCLPYVNELLELNSEQLQKF